MKKITAILIIVALVINVQAQKNATEQAIVDEGIALYKTEMASWHGTDVFRERLPEKMSQSGGYFSYPDEQGGAKCVFYDLQKPPEAFVEMSFDSTYNLDVVKIDTTTRALTDFEKDLHAMRINAIQKIQTDTIFKHYNNTSFNIIPLIRNGEKKVFVLTGPQAYGVVIFGNDYLMTFDENNEVVSAKSIHQNIIPVEYGHEDTTIIHTVHYHLPETGDYITSTDICTLMLYSKFAKWKQHTVMSKKYMSMWSCENNSFFVLPMETADAIYEDVEKRNEKRKKATTKKERKKRKKRKSKN